MSEAPLDIEQHDALVAYLRRGGHIGDGETPTVRTLSGGVSNRTVLVDRGNGQAWVIKQALGRLRVEADWFSDPRRIHREAEGMRHLAALCPPGSITPLIFEDAEHQLLAMAAVGEPHENWKQMLLAGRIESDHVTQFAQLLGVIHQAGDEQRDELAQRFVDRSFFESLRLEPYYTYTAEQVPAAATFLRRLIETCRARRITLVHGDYSPKNILVHNNRLVLLDHEVIHFGDPAFDLGFAMTHLLSKAHHVRDKREVLVQATQLFWQIYCEALGDSPWAADLEAHAVHHTLGCLLARVAGRSPLEYLSDTEKDRQRNVVVSLMHNPPACIGDLISDFLQEL